jgi:protein required for attachment to host cells
MGITTWIVSANAGRARIICESAPNHPLVEVEDMVNHGAPQDTDAAGMDRPGVTAAAQSTHANGGALADQAGQGAAPPAQRSTAGFARHICACLERARAQGRFDQLVLVAAPEFIGVLRAQMGRQLDQLVTRELGQDHTRLPPQQLREQMGPYP